MAPALRCPLAAVGVTSLAFRLRLDYARSTVCEEPLSSPTRGSRRHAIFERGLGGRPVLSTVYSCLHRLDGKVRPRLPGCQEPSSRFSRRCLSTRRDAAL